MLTAYLLGAGGIFFLFLLFGLFLEFFLRSLLCFYKTRLKETNLRKKLP